MGSNRYTMIRGQTEAHLVDQQETRTGDERPGHCEHLLFAPAEQAGLAGHERLERRKHLHRPFVRFGPSRPVTVESESQILLHRQVEEERTVLHHVRQAAVGDLVRRHRAL